MKIRPVGAELFHTKLQTDRQTDEAVACRNFAKALKISYRSNKVIKLPCATFPLFYKSLESSMPSRRIREGSR
jgi:hypothetical protein